ARGPHAGAAGSCSSRRRAGQSHETGPWAPQLPAAPAATGKMAAAGAEERPGSRRDSGSGEDSLDTLLSRLPLTPALSPRKRTMSQSKTEPPLLRTSKRTIYTAGRPPWYTETGTPFKEAFVIA
ncbi:unnamed protein product, partial [Lepidochelys kempii]